MEYVLKKAEEQEAVILGETGRLSKVSDQEGLEAATLSADLERSRHELAALQNEVGRPDDQLNHRGGELSADTARGVQVEKDLHGDRNGLVVALNSMIIALNHADADRWELENRLQTLKDEVVQCEAVMAAMNAERERLTETIRRQEELRSQLSAELAKAYRRPFRPLRYMATSAVLKTLAALRHRFPLGLPNDMRVRPQSAARTVLKSRRR